MIGADIPLLPKSFDAVSLNVMLFCGKAVTSNAGAQAIVEPKHLGFMSGQDEKVFLAFKVFLAVAFSCHDRLVGGDGEEIAAVGGKFFLPLEAERGGIASDFIGDGVVFHTQRCFIAVKIDDGGFSCDAEENDHGVFLCAVEIPGRDEQVAACGAEGEGVYVRAEIHLG